MANAQLVYCILADDVRLEIGNKLSLMGVFENVFFPQFPAMLLKFAVVNHWIGDGHYQTQVKILSPDRREIGASVPSPLVIEGQGYADNITFFTNLGFERQGSYTIQVFLDGHIAAEKRLNVHLITTAGPPTAPGTTIN